MVRVTFEILRKMTKGFQRQNKKPRLECQMQSRRECSCVTNYSKCSTMHMIVGNVSNYRIFSRSYSVMIYVQNMTWFCSMLCSNFQISSISAILCYFNQTNPKTVRHLESLVGIQIEILSVNGRLLQVYKYL